MQVRSVGGASCNNHNIIILIISTFFHSRSTLHHSVRSIFEPNFAVPTTKSFSANCSFLAVNIFFFLCWLESNNNICLFPVLEAMNSAAGAAGAGGLFAPLGPDRVSPGMVIDVAGLILQGFHAVPVKLKMLLDRLFSLLSPEEITAVLRSFGWSIQDYQRGYILKVRPAHQ